MNKPVSPEVLKQLFTEARSHHAWTDRPVSDDQLHELYELTKWGPTSVNANPARFVFVRSDEAKAKLLPALMGWNVEQVQAAPVTVIVATDEKFYDQLVKLFPAKDYRSMFADNPGLSQSTADRSGTLQGAYMLMAARSLGLDICPMSGFDHAKIDAAFFEGTSYKTNFIFTLGYGDTSKLHPRGPRLDFDEAAKIV